MQVWTWVHEFLLLHFSLLKYIWGKILHYTSSRAISYSSKFISGIMDFRLLGLAPWLIILVSFSLGFLLMIFPIKIYVTYYLYTILIITLHFFLRISYKETYRDWFLYDFFLLFNNVNVYSFPFVFSFIVYNWPIWFWAYSCDYEETSNYKHSKYFVWYLCNIYPYLFLFRESYNIYHFFI